MICRSCGLEENEAPIWRTFRAIEENAKLKGKSLEDYTCSLAALVHLTGCKVCNLRHPMVVNKVKDLALEIANGDNISIKDATEYVVKNVMGGYIGKKTNL